MTISVEGGRVLGCLVEKQLATPQQYPLSLNALLSACNQTTNRQPVMTLDDLTVERALTELKALGLVRFVLPSHGKSVTRYRHVFDEAYGLDPQRTALMATLLLRGPQTAGELRSRTERMAELDSPAAVNAELARLADHPQPVVRLLPRRPGQKEDRWQQLLAAEASASDPSVVTDPVIVGKRGAEPSSSNVSQVEGHGSSTESPDGTRATDLVQRMDALEGDLTDLRREVAILSESLGQLRRSLGDEDNVDEGSAPPFRR